MDCDVLIVMDESIHVDSYVAYSVNKYILDVEYIVEYDWIDVLVTELVTSIT